MKSIPTFLPLVCLLATPPAAAGETWISAGGGLIVVDDDTGQTLSIHGVPTDAGLDKYMPESHKEPAPKGDQPSE